MGKEYKEETFSDVINSFASHAGIESEPDSSSSVVPSNAAEESGATPAAESSSNVSLGSSSESNGAAPVAPVVSAPPETAKPVDSAEVWQKRYTDLQSFHDKRFNEMKNEMAELKGLLSQQVQKAPPTPSPSALAQLTPEDWNDVLSDPQKMQAFIKNATVSTVSSDFGIDQNVAATTKKLASVLQYRQKYPDSPQYDDLVGKVLDEFGGENADFATYERAYRFARKFIEDLQAKVAAIPQGEAASTNGQQNPPQAPSPVMTAKQAAEFKQRADRLRQEANQNIDPQPTKPKPNKFSGMPVMDWESAAQWVLDNKLKNTF